MARLAQGDRDALTPLVERHYRRLYRIALAYLREREDALDVVQEAFVKAFQAAGRWDGSADAGPWLSRITVNLAIDRWRRNPPARPDILAARGGRPQRDACRRRTRAGPPCAEARGGERVALALRALPERQRAVVVLRHYQELSLEEIASTLGMSLGTVKSSLHRALSRMRATLAGSQP